MEGVCVDAKYASAAGEVVGREACDIFVEGGDRCTGDGVDDDDAEEGRGLRRDLRG